jgi:hypothetical protein
LDNAYGRPYDNAAPQERLIIGKVILKGDNFIQFEVHGKPTMVFPVTDGLRVNEIIDSSPRIYRDAPTDLSGQQWYQHSQALRNVRIGDTVMFSIGSKDSVLLVGSIYIFDDGSVFGGR